MREREREVTERDAAGETHWTDVIWFRVPCSASDRPVWREGEREGCVFRLNGVFKSPASSWRCGRGSGLAPRLEMMLCLALLRSSLACLTPALHHTHTHTLSPSAPLTHTHTLSLSPSTTHTHTFPLTQHHSQQTTYRGESRLLGVTRCRKFDDFARGTHWLGVASCWVGVASL